MKRQTYSPQPIDTSDIQLPAELEELVEEMSKNVHDVWSQTRISQGWTYGEQRDDTLKKHPCLIPYEVIRDLPGRFGDINTDWPLPSGESGNSASTCVSDRSDFYSLSNLRLCVNRFSELF